MKIVECVPNFSEGRDAGVLDEIASCFARGGVALLDRTADEDHNRSVYTVAGEAEAVAAAILCAAGVAARNIDMRSHTGEHPCIGSIDVVPFVPLGNMSMSDAARLASLTAQGISTAYEIPTYLYGEAATRPQYVNLAEVRKGGFAGLKSRLATLDGMPDYGAPRPHPTAGATAVGARNFLIAFNINLASSDVRAAKRIASKIRERDGGLRGVKALGIELGGRGLAQVSMNLVDFRMTSPIAAFRAVERLAHEEGIRIAESELIGLIPRAAAEGLDAGSVRLTCALEERILETKLAKFGF